MFSVVILCLSILLFVVGGSTLFNRVCRNYNGNSMLPLIAILVASAGVVISLRILLKG